MIKISVIIPVYNMEKSLEKCLESVLNQSYSNFELILVDDGSSDQSYEICSSLAKKDYRIKVIRTENRGSGPARNTGINIACGDYVYFPDADDILAVNTLETLSKIVEKEQFDLLVFGYQCVNSKMELISEKKYKSKIVDGKEIRDSYFPYMMMTSPFGIQGAPWNKLFKLSIMKENNVYFPSLRRHQDDAFIGKYMGYVTTVCFIEDVFYTYYLNDLSKEWDKYPTSYLDAVIGLNKIREETIWLWNKDDYETHNVLRCEYICNSIKALELSFSPKWGLSILNRQNYINNSIAKARLNTFDFPDVLGYRYQKKVMEYINHDQRLKLYLLLYMKVFLQKNLYPFYIKVKKKIKSN
ncbi:glycosyltransferase [Exiguobacterium sp. s151]|uniref:glycosyltransferase family 2 protein n=1 Tax=Exiguobacterium sp. s151 TaxID=2751229 RepID=UPI001BE6AA64|nr:glycosyltransferase [Exiguobacterium sp. s151]